MKFTCHAIGDGDVFNGKTIGWCVVGQGRIWVTPYLTTSQDLARTEFPDAEFEKSIGIDRGEEEHLLGGVEAYYKWWNENKSIRS